MPPLLDRLFGLLLLPGKRLCVGDVGDLTGSAVLGRAERLRGCVPSSYIKDTKLLLKQGRPIERCFPPYIKDNAPEAITVD